MRVQEHLNLAQQLLRQGDHAAALDLFRRVLEASMPTAAMLAAVRGSAACHAAMGSLKEAVCQLGQAVDAAPDRGQRAALLAEKGCLHEQLEQYDAASAAFLKALDSQPDCRQVGPHCGAC